MDTKKEDLPFDKPPAGEEKNAPLNNAGNAAAKSGRGGGGSAAGNGKFEPVVVTTSKSAAVGNASPIQVIATRLNNNKKTLVNMLGSEGDALRFLSAVMHSLQKTPKLLECSLDSVFFAFMEAAGLGLYPSDSSGDCFVLPYKGRAQFQLGYKGARTLAYRGGVIRIGTELVYSHDFFKRHLGTDQRLEHVPDDDLDDRGQVTGVYAWAEVVKGSIMYFYMTPAEVMAIKKMSPAAKSEYLPWNSGDPQKWMWRKTAIKQLAKTIPSNDALARAIHIDGIMEAGGSYSPTGEILEPERDPLDRGMNKKEQLKIKQNEQ